MSLAGVLGTGRMQSFKLDSHWAFERTNVGGGQEVFHRTHISVQASRPIQVYPRVRSLVGAAKLGPPTLTGGFFTSCPGRTHTPASAGHR